MPWCCSLLVLGIAACCYGPLCLPAQGQNFSGCDDVDFVVFTDLSMLRMVAQYVKRKHLNMGHEGCTLSALYSRTNRARRVEVVQRGFSFLMPLGKASAQVYHPSGYTD